jgi:hypothetical protein
MLSGQSQNSNANQPNVAGLMGVLSGRNSISSHTNTGKAVVMGTSYHHGDYQVKSS